MSYFAFKRNDDGEMIVDNASLAAALELLINQVCLLNARFEEAFDTKIEDGDVN